MDGRLWHRRSFLSEEEEAVMMMTEDNLLKKLQKVKKMEGRNGKGNGVYKKEWYMVDVYIAT